MKLQTGTFDCPYLKRYGFEQGIRRIAELGFDAIDYQGLAPTDSDTIYALEGHAFEAELKRQRAFIEAQGLFVNQTHGPWRYPPRDATPEDRAERFEKMTRALEATALLGSRNCVIHPIMPFGPDEGVHTQEMWEMNVEYMGRLSEEGRRCGVVVNLENMPFLRHCTSTPEAIVRLVKQIGSPWLKVCLDTGHCMVVGVQPGVAVRQVGKEYLSTLHVHDNNGERDLHWLPFTGKADWEYFRRSLAQIGYEGVLSLETGIPHQMPPELASLQEQSTAQMARLLAACE